ncbi:MAG: ABC transporter permease [Clostridiales Family XIII bacterium]|jgi:osmoprotectant transport system permease protein|nr:ABC transporter permease [Clostridiales Family XIII bacterium]
MIEYAARYGNKLEEALIQHLQIVGLTLLISIVLASAVTLVVMRSARAARVTIRIFGGVYAIPSLALFALLIPVTGLGMDTAILVLVVYNQFLLIRNFIAGLDSVDPLIVEAATGMGMTPRGILTKIRLPLAFPVMLAGIHLSVISTIGIATIAAVIGAGGIGTILFDGLRTQSFAKIAWGTLLAAGLAIAANLILIAIEKSVSKKYHYNTDEEDNAHGSVA